MTNPASEDMCASGKVQLLMKSIMDHRQSGIDVGEAGAGEAGRNTAIVNEFIRVSCALTSARLVKAFTGWLGYSEVLKPLPLQRLVHFLDILTSDIWHRSSPCTQDQLRSIMFSVCELKASICYRQPPT